MIIYRGTSEFLNIEIDNNTQLKQELSGEDIINANFTLEFYYDFRIGDYINWRGKKYTIFKTPSTKKSKTNEIVYSIEFASDQYRLLNAIYLFDGNIEFYLLGDLRKFAELLISNLNRLAGSNYYSLGTVPDTAVKNLSFSNANCLLVLQQISSEFGYEFQFSNSGTTIDFISKIGSVTNLVFEFKEGLRNIERQKVSDKSLVTRLYAFGGERNITSDYGSKKLKINPLEDNVDIFGVIEGVVQFDEVYPHREGTISAVGSDEFKFSDSSMDFDINDQLIDGVVAKVTFNTGYLAGYEFEIHSYNSISKEFDIIQYEDENGLILPNAVLKPAIGDKYVIHDVIMPQTYIDAAESELLTKATAYLSENSKPNVIFNIVPHYPYLRTNLIQLNIGDIVTVKDDDFGIEYETRILSLTQSLANPYLYSIKVGDKVTVNYITKVLSNQLETDNNVLIERYDRTVQYNRIRRNLKNIDELKESIFDPDGYFDAEKIKPLSIETTMLSVGGKSQQFIIRELLIEANYQSDPNKTFIGDGTLVHFLIEDTITEWSLTGSIKNHADTNQYYYIYARCVRGGTTGDFLTTSVQYQVDSGSTYYYFLIGVIHSAQDNVRGISLTYGQTTINGKFITTGRIQSVDGINYFDLDSGQFFIGDGNSSLDWNVTAPNKLTLKGSLLQTPAGNAIVIPNLRGDYNNATVYYEGDVISYNSSSYYKITSTGASGLIPTNTTHWKIFANEGPQGVQGVDGLSTYTWIRYADDVNGTGISNNPTGKTYIGFAYNKTTATESNNPTDYTWGLFSGEGVPGPPGADGQTTYTWIKYSDASDGTGLYDVPNSNTQYIGISVNRTTTTESTDKTDYLWSKFKGDTGNTGLQGPQGPQGLQGSIGPTGPSGIQGPALVFRGNFQAGLTYYNSTTRRDVVKQSGVHYYFTGTNGTVQGSFIAGNWSNFGAQFESVATNLLLAESANIADWIINNGKITSQAQYNGQPRAQLNGQDGKLTFISALNTYNQNGGGSTYTRTTEIDSLNGSFESSHNGDTNQNSGLMTASSEGVFCNYAGTQGAPASSGIEIKGAIVGLGFGKLTKTAYNSSAAIVGVYGRSSNSASNPADSFGGWFDKLRVNGMYMKIRRITSNTTLNEADYMVSCYNTSTISVTLPANPQEGQVINIRRNNSATVNILGNGTQILVQNPQTNHYVADGQGDVAELIFDGSYWLYNKSNR